MILNQLPIEIVGIVEIPVPIARGVEIGVEVGMPILQLPEHVAQCIEERILVHRVGDQCGIALVYRIPIHLFIGEEAVVLIHDLPKRLKISSW